MRPDVRYERGLGHETDPIEVREIGVAHFLDEKDDLGAIGDPVHCHRHFHFENLRVEVQNFLRHLYCLHGWNLCPPRDRLGRSLDDFDRPRAVLAHRDLRVSGQ